MKRTNERKSFNLFQKNVINLNEYEARVLFSTINVDFVQEKYGKWRSRFGIACEHIYEY